MKATGYVRTLDELGRVVIPKEIRRQFNIPERGQLEVFTDMDRAIVLKPYEPFFDKEQWAIDTITKHHKEILTVTMVSDEIQAVFRTGQVKRAKCLSGTNFSYNVGVAICIFRALNLSLPEGV